MESVYTEESVNKLSEAEFYERFGVGSVFFGVLLDRLKEYREKQRVKGGTPEPPVRFSEPCHLFALYPSIYDANDTGGYHGSKKMGRIKSVSLDAGCVAEEWLFPSYRKQESREGNFCPD